MSMRSKAIIGSAVIAASLYGTALSGAIDTLTNTWTVTGTEFLNGSLGHTSLAIDRGKFFTNNGDLFGLGLAVPVVVYTTQNAIV